MRRKDREITGFDEMVGIIDKCDVCRLALNDDGAPYILPLNFGYAVSGGRLVFYFHGALSGKKLDLIAKDPHAAFELDCGHALITNEEKGDISMLYQSVIGKGVIEMIPDEDKEEALGIILRHYGLEGFKYNTAMVRATGVFKLVVGEMTAKARPMTPGFKKV